MRKVLLIGGLVLSIFSCSVQNHKSDNTRDLVNATIWMQNAGEYKALTLQAYQLGYIRLNEILETDESEKPKAIVLDIDETVLDNSPYQGYQILNDKPFNQKDWNKWTSLGIAEAIPGALNFLNYAKSKGVEIFYVSNRLEAERSATLLNLQREKFPFSDNEHLILRTKEASKEFRRQQLLAHYNIVLYFGDNLSDFSDIYYRNTTGRTSAEMVLENPEVFGTKFIVLPNAMYGDWETKMYKNNKDKLSKEQLKNKALHSFGLEQNNLNKENK